MTPFKTCTASDGRTVVLINKPSEEQMLKYLKAEIDRRIDRQLRQAAENKEDAQK